VGGTELAFFAAGGVSLAAAVYGRIEMARLTSAPAPATAAA